MEELNLYFQPLFFGGVFWSTGGDSLSSSKNLKSLQTKVVLERFQMFGGLFGVSVGGIASNENFGEIQKQSARTDAETSERAGSLPTFYTKVFYDKLVLKIRAM